MKISKAIRTVESIFSDSPNIVSDEDNESVEFALKAMDKQDPIKPIEEGKQYYCPICELNIGWADDYCWHCGQKMDWRD